MRKQICIMWFLLSVLPGICEYSYGWGNKKTHQAITDKAIGVSVIDDYLKTQLDLADGVSTELYWDFPSDIKERLQWGKAKPDKTTRTMLEWIKTGSLLEDEDGRWKPIRPRHHFHDPTRNAGLDNQTDHYDWKTYACTKTGFDFTGESAMAWAIDGTAEKDPTVNNQSWGDAREDFYAALTLSGKSKREEYLAKTLLDLGHVLHLIEDTGVPAHARNDFLFAHYRTGRKNGNELERWAEEKIFENKEKIPSGWLTGWTPQANVFDKLAKYFDADQYVGDYLGGGQLPPEDSWGLSECSNYQFLSWSTMFVPDVFPYYSLYSFPHPSLTNISTITENKRDYLSGYGITHLAWVFKRDEYLGGESKYRSMPFAVVGDEVCLDYAKMTIPRTIDYVTGLANYFFRGRLSVEAEYISYDTIELTITNTSKNSDVEQTLKGGAFVGREAKVPVDFNEILACVAPRPMLVIAPTGDRHANYTHIAAAVEQAKKVYELLNAEETIELQSPDDWNRLTDEMQTAAIQWLKHQAGK